MAEAASQEARRLFFVAEIVPTGYDLIDPKARTMMNDRDEIAVEDMLAVHSAA